MNWNKPLNRKEKSLVKEILHLACVLYDMGADNDVYLFLAEESHRTLNDYLEAGEKRIKNT